VGFLNLAKAFSAIYWLLCARCFGGYAYVDVGSGLCSDGKN